MQHGYQILLVEDNADDVILIRRAFRRAGIAARLEQVSDGDAAVNYLNGSEPYGDREQFPIPDVLLLDLKLPRRSGLEVLQWLRQEPVIKRMPVVVLTSSAQNSDVDRAYELGANSYLVKPVEFNDLLDMMRVVESYWLRINQRPTLT